MTDHLHFAIGDEVFVRDPSTLVSGSVSIVGVIDEIEQLGTKALYTFNGSVWNGSESEIIRMALPAMKLGHRVGIPLSQLDGRNGGNEAWRRISESWGYSDD